MITYSSEKSEIPFLNARIKVLCISQLKLVIMQMLFPLALDLSLLIACILTSRCIVEVNDMLLIALHFLEELKWLLSDCAFRRVVPIWSLKM